LISQFVNHRFSRLASLQTKAMKADTQRDWKEEWKASTIGQHLRRIDSAIPGPHVRKLYDHLSRHRAAFPTQLRIGHNWLKSFQKHIEYSEVDRRECGAVETTVHIFIDCPKQRELRRQLRKLIGDRFNSLATILGGRAETRGQIRIERVAGVYLG